MAGDLHDPLLTSRRPDQNKIWGAFKEELLAIVALCGPACVQLGFQQAVLVTNQIYAGSLGADALAAAAIGFTLFNLLWYFLLGVGSALDTLGSQAYGAADRAGVLSWAITAAIVMSLFGVPMAFALYHGGFIAIHVFRQDVRVAQLVEVYCRGMIPGLWPYILSCVIMKALQAQNLMWAPATVTVSMFFVNIGFNAVFVRNWGFTGAAYAQSASRIAQFCLLVGDVLTVGRSCLSFEREAEVIPCPDEDPSVGTLIRDAYHQFSDDKESAEASGKFPFGKESPASPLPPVALTPPMPAHLAAADEYFGSPIANQLPPAPAPEIPYVKPTLKAILKDAILPSSFWEFLKLAIPGGIMMQIEGNSYDITNILASMLGTIEVDAHNVVLTICEFSYVAVPFGIATAATIRVGNMLGANNPESARRSAYICIALCLLFECVTASLILGFRSRLGRVFVDNDDVVALVSKIAVLAAVYQLPDGLYGTVSGVLRALGRQPQLLWVNLGGFWGVGMSLGVLLTFRLGCGEIGLWWGLLAGITATAAICTAMLALVDWAAEARKAREQLAASAASAAEEAGDDEEEAADRVPVLAAAPTTSQGASVPASAFGDGQQRPADRWSHLPRRGGPAGSRPLLIRRVSSLGNPLGTPNGSWAALIHPNTATRMFAPGARN